MTDTRVDSQTELLPPDPHPHDFDLPHDSWREGQLDSIQYLLARQDNSVTVMQAATGSGKTSLSRAMAKKLSVTTLVRTKNLQVENYEHLYNFDVLFGRANYPCVHPDREGIDDTATQCLYEGEMMDCECADECPYLIQKHKVQASRKRSLNYSYFLTAKWPRLPQHTTKYIFYDECHNLPDETLDFVSCTIREADRIRWRLPEYPSCYDSSRDNINLCLKWMEQSIGILKLSVIENKKETDAYHKGLVSKAERLTAKLAQTCSAIHISQDDWFVRSGQRALTYDGKMVPGLVVKPLTARYHFPRLFLGIYPRTVLMSATIGNHADFCEELGIHKYDFHAVPNQFGPKQRPVHILDVPSMGQSVTEAGRVKHAEVIAKSINGCPADWSGIIHVTSWKSAWDLRNRLSKAGVKPQRLFIPDRGGTNKQIAQWNEVKGQSKGMLVITPSMNAGVDLLEERICIIAKVPWGYAEPGTYSWERIQFSNKFYRWQTASDLEQRCGRTRRGRPEDYDSEWQVNGYVAIADGSFRKMGLGKSCSNDFNDSLT